MEVANAIRGLSDDKMEGYLTLHWGGEGGGGEYGTGCEHSMYTKPKMQP